MSISPLWQKDVFAFSESRGVKILSLKDYTGSDGSPPSAHCWFDYNSKVPVRSSTNICTHSCTHGGRWQVEEQGRPFAHQQNLDGVALLLADLLETTDVRRRRPWFSLVNQSYRVVEQLHNHRGDPAYRNLIPVERDGQPTAFVLDRDLYMHVDSARVKNTPDTWTKSVGVIKLRVPGIVVGCNQFCGPLLSPFPRWGC